MARKPNPPTTPDPAPADKAAATPSAGSDAGSSAPGSSAPGSSAPGSSASGPEGAAPVSPLDEKFALPVGVAAPVVPTTKPPVKQLIADETPAAPLPGAKEAAEDDDDQEEEDDEEDDDDDEELVVFTAREAAGAFATIAGFIRPVVVNYKKMLAFVVFGVVVETLFNVIMPLSLKFLIDDALGEEDFRELYKILSILGVAGIITSIVAVWYERWDARLAAAVVADVRTRVFEHVQRLPAGYFARTKRGEILSRFSIDMAAFESVVEILANTALLPFLELIAGIILMLFLNWQLAVVALLIFPITLIGPRILTPKAVQANYEQKVQEAGLLGLVQENVGAQAVVKAFSLQRKMFGFFSLRNQATRQKMAQATFLTSMVERSVTVSVLMLHLLVLALGAYLATTGQITVGTFVTFESAFWEVSYNIAHLMQFIPVSIQAAAAVRHMQELLDEKTPIADRQGAAELPRIVDNIAFERVSFAYEGAEQPVIDNLSLKLKAGKTIAIVGPSGSGKSTLLNMVLRLYDPTEGRITIDGVDIRNVTLDSLRRSMAVVFQENMLFNMSIRDNIRLGKEGATDAEVVQAAKKAEIHRFIMSLPEKYDTVVGERGDTLSGGQRQRIAIARAIVRDPSVLLLDEATSALDQTTEAAINKTLMKLARGRTMIFSTHRLTSVVDMDEIVVVSGGQAIERGSHQELLAQNGAYRKLWDDQKRHGAGDDDDDDDDDDE